MELVVRITGETAKHMCWALWKPRDCRHGQNKNTNMGVENKQDGVQDITPNKNGLVNIM